MPTINAGSTFTTTIPAGTRFGMGRGTGTYRVGPIGSSASPTIEELIDPEGTWLGPFSGDCSLSVRATTAVTYNTVAPFDALTQTQVVASPEVAASLVSGAWKVAGTPGAVTAGELNALMAAMSAAGGGSVLFPPSATPYVFDEELLMASNVTIILSPGVVITRPDPFTLTCTTANGSPNVTVTGGDTSRLKVGFYAAQYITGTGIPLATRVSAVVGAQSFQLDKPATATGPVTLTFHWAHNVIRRDGVTNARIMAPWGRATIDGNGASSPITFDSADALRNCIRTANCTDIETSGLMLQNAHYHGEIGTTNAGKIRLSNILTQNNGFRAVHYHGDSPTSAITDFFADEIESYQDGWKAWTIQGDQLNTGIFLTFDNTTRQQIGRLRVRRCAGGGVMLTGNISSGVRSNKIRYDSIACEDVAVPLVTQNGLKGVQLNIQASGSLITCPATILGTGTSQLPLWQSNGSAYVVGALMASMVLPAGTDMGRLYIGQAVYLQDIAGGLDVKLAIWSVDAATRTIQVFNYNSPTTRPWQVGSDGASVLATIWTSRGPGWYLSGNVGNNMELQDIHVGSAQFDGIGDKSITCLNQGAVRYIHGLKIDSLSVRDCYSGSYLYCVRDFYIGSSSESGTGNRRTGNDNVSAGFYVNNSEDGFIGKLRGVSLTVGGMTRNAGCSLYLDAATNNIKVMDITAENSNGSALVVQAIGTNLMLGDPRNASGATFTPFTTGGTNVSVFRYGLA
jgi:hypothetical protein